MKKEYDFVKRWEEIKKDPNLTGKFPCPHLIEGEDYDDESDDPIPEEALKDQAEAIKEHDEDWRKFKAGELSPDDPIYKMFKASGYDGLGGDGPPNVPGFKAGQPRAEPPQAFTGVADQDSHRFRPATDDDRPAGQN